MKKEIYLSVVVPAYNEEKLIKSTLLDTIGFLFKQIYDFEIIVVDDGSTDRTAKIVEELKASFKDLFLIKNDRNFGKGYSVKKGMLAAKGRFRLFMDADNSTNIKQIEHFIPFLESGYDLVIGDRTLKESVIEKHQPFYKEVMGKMGNVLIKTLLTPGINDTQCGFKCFSGNLVENIFPRLTINRWGFDAEILAVANEFRYKIKTVPIVWKNRKESKVFFRDYFLTLLDFLKIKINLIKKIYDQK
jgi:dolichyl-phosphate beta-glucosyltransferase